MDETRLREIARAFFNDRLKIIASDDQDLFQAEVIDSLELMELLRLGDSLRVALRDPVAEPLTLFDCDPLLVAPERERDSEALTEPLRERLCVADGE